MNTSKINYERESDWQTIGGIELSVGIGTNDAIHAWLIEILNTLNLATEFFERFLKAAQTTVTRDMRANGLASLVYVHISILAPQKHNSTGKSWGFFQIEKIETKADNVNTHIRAIDFYLYVEGD